MTFLIFSKLLVLQPKQIIPPKYSLDIPYEPSEKSTILSVSSWVFQMGRNYFMKLFHVLRGEDLNKTIRQAEAEVVPSSSLVE